jgi:hypothetical protein
MVFDRESCSFFMDDIGQDCIFFSGFDIMFFSIICKLISGFLSHHTLLDSFFTSPIFLPVFSRSIDTQYWVYCLLHAFVSYFCKSELEGFGVWTWDRLDEAKDGLYISDISLSLILPSGACSFNW